MDTKKNAHIWKPNQKKIPSLPYDMKPQKDNQNSGLQMENIHSFHSIDPQSDTWMESKRLINQVNTLRSSSSQFEKMRIARCKQLNREKENDDIVI